MKNTSPSSSPTRVFVVGNGVSKFAPPSKKGKRKEGADARRPAPRGGYPVFEEAAAAAGEALSEAGLTYEDVTAAVCGYAFSDSTAGQAACYKLGLTGIPVFNTNNACASGSTALCLARTLVQSGQYDCVLALGFERLSGNVKEAYPEHNVYGGHLATLERMGLPIFPGAISGSIANAYIRCAKDLVQDGGAMTDRHFAMVAHKNRRHGARNPKALLHGAPVPSVEDIAAAPRLFGGDSPLTYSMVAPAACGAAAAVVVSEAFLLRMAARQEGPPACTTTTTTAAAGGGGGGGGGGDGGGAGAAAPPSRRPVEIAGQALRTDTAASFDVARAPRRTLANLCGWDGSRRAADAALGEAGVAIADVDVAEVHDAFASSEIAMCEALRLTSSSGGKGGGTGDANGDLSAMVQFVEQGEWRDNGQGGELFHQPVGRGGRTVVVNPSGGLESKGHPTGATGLAQAAEICWQLRGTAGARQVPGAQVGLAHNYGWSSAAVVTVFRSCPPPGPLVEGASSRARL